MNIDQDRIDRTIAGLLAMNRMAKDRMTALEARCDKLEQAILEIAHGRAARHGGGGVGSPFTPASRRAP